MKQARVLVALALAVATGIAVAAPEARAEPTRVTYPTALSLELFGRGLLYGISFDRVINEDLVAGLSFGRTPMKDLNGNDAGVSADLIPVYMNVYFARDASSLFVTAGATIVANSGDVGNLKTTYGGIEIPNTPVLPTFGLGYEDRGDNGVLFRATGYGIFGNKLAPWFGLTLGFSF